MIHLANYKIYLISLFVLLAATPAAYSNAVIPTIGENQILQTEAEQFGKEWSLKSIETAVEKYTQAAGNWKKLNKPHEQIHCLIEAGRLILITGDHKQSLAFLNDAVKIAENGKFKAETAVILAEMSRVYLGSGQIGKSKIFIDKALSLDETLPDSDKKASLYFCAGDFFYNQRNIEKSVEFYLRAVNLSLKNNDPKSLATSRLFLGYAKLFQNDYDSAMKIFEQALSDFQTINDKRGECLTKIAVGNLLSSKDSKQKALELYQEAEKDFPDDVDFVDKARLFNGIGLIYEDYNELELSINYRRKALYNFEKADYKYGQLATLSRLGSLYRMMDKPDLSVQYLNSSQNLATKLNDSLYLAIIAEEFGHLNFNTGDFQAALRNYKPALDYFQKTQNLREISLINNKIGRIYYFQKNFQQSRIFLNNAVYLNEKIQSKFDLAQTLYYLALLNYAESDFEAALKNTEKSLALTNSLYHDVFNSKIKKTYFSTVSDSYELSINLLMKMREKSPDENYAFRALQTVETSRARAMLENLSLSEADFAKDADVEIIKREKEIRTLLNSKADILTDLLSENAAETETDKISDEINELENQLEEIKANLKQNSPAYYAVKNPAPFDVAEFQQNVLDENSLLLEFSFGKNESYLWLIGKNEFASYVLPPREQIENKIEKLRELLASREMLKDETIESFQTRIAQAEKEYALISGELSRDLFGQVAGKFGNKKLIIVPDGKLGVFPAAALPFPDSEKNEPILLSNEVVYEPSASTLSLIAKFGQQAKSPTKSLLIFSDPVFSVDDNRLSGTVQDDKPIENERAESFRFVESLNSLERLKSSKTEADSIINILGKSNVESFSGFSANRERLINANVSDYKILHFATHGIIDENRPELSGIVLSRFDENGQKRDEFFRLHDIYGMNLNSDLVVLSACYTGVGKEVKGEGLMSLNNAFLSVGAKSVLSSLWKVEDGATLELMKNFYEAMANEHLTPSKALQQAQIKMLTSERYKSPFYWAAFTVQGDFKNVPQISNSVAVWKYFLPMPVILFFGAFWGLRIIRRRNRM